MKKYKSFHYLIGYIENIFGPTLTELQLYDSKEDNLRIRFLKFRLQGCSYTIPTIIDWDWTRDDNGFHVTFFHLSENPSINKIIEDIIKEKLYGFGKISKNVKIYLNNNNISYE